MKLGRFGDEVCDWYGGAGVCGGRAERGGRCPRGSMIAKVLEESEGSQHMYAAREREPAGLRGARRVWAVAVCGEGSAGAEETGIRNFTRR